MMQTWRKVDKARRCIAEEREQLPANIASEKAETVRAARVEIARGIWARVQDFADVSVDGRRVLDNVVEGKADTASVKLDLLLQETLSVKRNWFSRSRARVRVTSHHRRTRVRVTSHHRRLTLMTSCHVKQTINRLCWMLLESTLHRRYQCCKLQTMTDLLAIATGTASEPTTHHGVCRAVARCAVMHLRTFTDCPTLAPHCTTDKCTRNKNIWFPPRSSLTLPF